MNYTPIHFPFNSYIPQVLPTSYYSKQLYMDSQPEWNCQSLHTTLQVHLLHSCLSRTRFEVSLILIPCSLIHSLTILYLLFLLLWPSKLLLYTFFTTHEFFVLSTYLLCDLMICSYPNFHGFLFLLVLYSEWQAISSWTIPHHFLHTILSSQQSLHPYDYSH